jgi:hypothetical protein
MIPAMECQRIMCGAMAKKRGRSPGTNLDVHDLNAIAVTLLKVLHLGELLLADIAIATVRIGLLGMGCFVLGL